MPARRTGDDRPGFALSPRFRVTVLAADDPMAALRRPYALRIDTADWPGEVFTLWFPECIVARGLGTAAANWEPGNDQHWEFSGGLLWHEMKRDAFAYRAEVAAREDALDLSLRFTNRSQEVYREGWVNLCMRTCNAPGFDDAELSRTFLRFDGRWTPLRETTPGEPQPAHRIYLVRDEVPYYQESLGAWPHAVPSQRADHPLIALVSADGRRTVGMASRPSVGFVSNLDRDMRCLHSNPLLGDVPPGATVEMKALVLFLNGGLQEAVARTDAWLAG
jgi:hypothetical protein